MSQRPNESMNYFELGSPVLLGPDITSRNGQDISDSSPAGFKDEQQRRSTSLGRTLPQYSHIHPQPHSRPPRPLGSSDSDNNAEDDGEEEEEETDDPDLISPFLGRGKTLSPRKSPVLAGLGEVGTGQGGTSPSKRLYDQMKGSAVYKVSFFRRCRILTGLTAWRLLGVHSVSPCPCLHSDSEKIFLYPLRLRIPSGLLSSMVPLTIPPPLKDPEARSPSHWRLLRL